MSDPVRIPQSAIRNRNTGGIFVGLMIMLIGASLFLNQIGFLDGLPYVPFWPVVVIIVGLVKLSQPRPDGRREGGWWVFFGVWLLLNQLHILRMREMWPLLLVALGISMIWKERRARARVE